MKHPLAPSRRCDFLVAISLLLSLLGFLPEAQAQDSPSRGKTIIVLDASGSMWGKVPGGVKIDIAKDTIARLVPSIDPEIELGLMVYGHRQKGDCTDIELLVPPGKNNRETILTKTRSLVPTGKTPLCDAVLMAADALQYEEDKATVILVSDGIETCGKDPATVGDLLAAQGIDFVCHVVAFDIEKEKNAGLDALSRKTGGLYLEAKDADSLWDALNEAMQAAVKPETALILSARNAAGELLDGVKFGIYRSKDSESPAFQGTGGKYRLTLEPGDYQVVGSFGANQADATVQIPPSKTTHYELTFEATGLTVVGLLTPDGPILESNLGWKVFPEPESVSDRKAIAFSYDAKATFQLAPGTYFLAGTYQESKSEIAIEVLAGKATTAKLVFGSGRIIAQARMSEDSPPITSNMSWELFPAAADAEGDRRKVAFSYDPKTEFAVPAGNYLLKAGHKQSATQKEVEVKAGENSEVTLTFGSGTVITHAVMAESSEFAEGGLSWKLLGPPNGEGKRKQAAFGYGNSETFKVPSGEYLLKLKRGSASTEKELVVSAGETTEITLNLNAGVWKGEAYLSEPSEEASTSGTEWGIFSQPNSEGKRKKIAFSYNEAEYYLPAGNYLARLTMGAAITEKEISISPGEMTENRLVLNAGTVLLKGDEGDGSPLIKVFPAEEEDPKQVAFDYKSEKQFILPAGKYIAHYTYKAGNEEVSKNTPFSVEAGKFKEVPIR